jgi:hypothetical protein
MPIWVVKAIWKEDDADVSERWEVSAPTAHDAVREAMTHIRFQPHYVQAHQFVPEEGAEADLLPGESRRLPPN